MFFSESRVRVYLYGQAVDMRKSFDGLSAIARSAFAQDPTGGHMYVFVSRRGVQIKVLYFDRSGWCVWAKRLEAGRFIGDWSKSRTHEIDCTQLKLLLEGIEPSRYRKRYRHHPPPDPHGDPRGELPVKPHRPEHGRQGNSDHSHGTRAGGSVA